MRKTKLKERIKNAYDAFFDESVSTENKLAFTFYDSHLESASKEVPQENPSLMSKFLRRSILYLPGVFILHFFSAMVTWTYLDQVDRLRNAWWGYILLFTVISSIFTITGIDDIRKRSTLAIPASVILVGVLTGLSAFLFTDITSPPTGLEIYFSYWLPFAYTAPFLVKYIVERSKEDSGS